MEPPIDVDIESDNDSSEASRRRQDIISQPIGEQLVKLTLPMLIAMVAIMGLGLVDSYFISFLGTTELAAIGFVTPITSLIQSFGLGLGMAISSLVSKLIGAGRIVSAARLITNGFYLTAMVGILSIGVLIWQLSNIFSLIGADADTMPAIIQYMSIWIFAAPFVLFSMASASTFRALGDTTTSAKLAMWMTVLNMILDPLLIFGIGPFPEMGMRGAALATVIAVVVSTSFGFHRLGVKEKFLLLTLPQWQEFKKSLRDLMEIAIPALLANGIVPLSAAVLTTLVASFGTDAVAGFGVGARIEAVTLIIVYALSSTLPAFIGQNLGAGKSDRVLQATDIAFRFTVFLQIGIYLLILALAKPIAYLFSDDAMVQNTITYFLWIVPISYGLSGVVILTNVSMNVLGKPRLAMYINLARLGLFYIPLAYLGGQWFGIPGLFIGVALANGLAYLLSRSLLRKTFRELRIIEAP